MDSPNLWEVMSKVQKRQSLIGLLVIGLILGGCGGDSDATPTRASRLSSPTPFPTSVSSGSGGSNQVQIIDDPTAGYTVAVECHNVEREVNFSGPEEISGDCDIPFSANPNDCIPDPALYHIPYDADAEYFLCKRR